MDNWGEQTLVEAFITIVTGAHFLVAILSKIICPRWWLNHPSEKYAAKIESFPQVGLKIYKMLLKPPPRIFW